MRVEESFYLLISITSKNFNKIWRRCRCQNDRKLCRNIQMGTKSYWLLSLTTWQRLSFSLIWDTEIKKVQLYVYSYMILRSELDNKFLHWQTSHRFTFFLDMFTFGSSWLAFKEWFNASRMSSLHIGEARNDRCAVMHCLKLTQWRKSSMGSWELKCCCWQYRSVGWFINASLH